MAALNDKGDMLTVSHVNPTTGEAVLKMKGVKLPEQASIKNVTTGESDSAHNAPGKKRGENIKDSDSVSIFDGLKAGPLRANIW